MSIYRQFEETNEHEGATWSWWLSAAGNETALDRLDNFLCGYFDDDNEVPYAFTGDELTGDQVALLVRYSDENYYPNHNRIDGVLTLPEVLDADFVKKLYKGGINDYFAASAEPPTVEVDAGPVSFGPDGFTVNT